MAKLSIGVLLPALLPIMAFIMHIKDVPTIFILYIIIFSCINPFFEEIFWRGLLVNISGNKNIKAIYSSALFSFSHLLFWSYWFKTSLTIITTMIATFLMGLLWMWFMNKDKKIMYPILSHIIVDILNLSVAVYVGVIPK